MKEKTSKFIYVFILSAGLLTLFPGLALGQHNNNKEHYNSRTLLRLGINDLRMGMLTDAAYYFHQYCIKNPKDMDAAWLLAEIYRKLGQYEKALPWYRKIANFNPAKNIAVKGAFSFIGDSRQTSRYRRYPLAGYYYALALKKTGDYESSNDEFRNFIYNYHEKDSARYAWEVNLEIEGNTLARNLLTTNPKIRLRELAAPGNGDATHFAPALFLDSTILYEDIHMVLDNGIHILASNMHYGKTVNGYWTDSGPVQNSPEQTGYINFGGCFSKDRKRYYFSRCAMQVDPYSDNNSVVKTTYQNGEICCSSYKNGRFGRPKPLDKRVNKPGYVNMMPALATDSQGRDVLYFVSNRPGSQGGLDIWKTIDEGGQGGFEEPVNLGPGVNTRNDEITPFYDQEAATLYFSSEGWPGFGGFDIFSTHWEAGGFDSVENLGYPFNSSYNERYFIIHHDHHYGMFNRSDYCQRSNMCYDYFYWLPFFECQSIFSFSTPMPQFAVRARVVSGTPKDTAYLAGAEIKISLADKMTEDEQTLWHFQQHDGKDFLFPLHPKIHYKIQVQADGFYPKDTMLNTDTFTVSDTVHYLFRLTRVPQDSPIVIRDIIFDFNDSTLSGKSKKIIDQTILIYLQKHPSEKILIISHSDSVGTDAYNMKLSASRAQSIVSYLGTKGISPNRMIAKGYGFRHPIAPNRHPDGTDNPEGREKNRRTVFIPIKK